MNAPTTIGRPSAFTDGAGRGSEGRIDEDTGVPAPGRRPGTCKDLVRRFGLRRTSTTA